MKRHVSLVLFGCYLFVGSSKHDDNAGKTEPVDSKIVAEAKGPESATEMTGDKEKTKETPPERRSKRRSLQLNKRRHARRQTKRGLRK